MKDKITKNLIEESRHLTNKALEIAKGSVYNGKQKESYEIIKIVEDYLSDSKYFELKNDFINSFGAIYYAHGWLDCGVKLGIFDVDNDELFVMK